MTLMKSQNYFDKSQEKLTEINVLFWSQIKVISHMLWDLILFLSLDELKLIIQSQ